MLTNRLIKLALNALKPEFIPLGGKEICREEGHVKMEETIYAKEEISQLACVVHAFKISSFFPGNQIR